MTTMAPKPQPECRRLQMRESFTRNSHTKLCPFNSLRKIYIQQNTKQSYIAWSSLGLTSHVPPKIKFNFGKRTKSIMFSTPEPFNSEFYRSSDLVFKQLKYLSFWWISSTAAKMFNVVYSP